MMAQKDAENFILEKLYSSYFHDGGALNLHSVHEELGMDKTSLWNTVDYLAHHGYIKAWAMGGHYIIQAYGIIYVEENGLAPLDLIEKNQHVRTVALDKMATIYEESGSYADVHIENLSKESGIDINLMVYNLQVLEDLGYIDTIAIGSYKITYEGAKFS